MKEFIGFPKIPRLSRTCTITEKIDGTNASIYIGEDGEFLTGSRNRWITPTDDNYGFSRWAHENKEELMKLGPGHHFGEWWGQGIQRGYGLKEKRFSLFATHRWKEDSSRPKCCHVVPTLYEGEFSAGLVERWIEHLAKSGSFATSFPSPEGIIIYHHAANQYFKKTIEDDANPKGK